MQTILVIEDEPDIAKVIAMRLKREGYKVVLAPDGLLAISIAQKSDPDLIILDMMLPAGDGISVLQRLKKSFKTCDVPVIILTSLQDSEYKEKSLAEGADVFLNKPYQPEKLLAEIKRLIG